MQKGKYFKFIIKSCGNAIYKQFISISIQKAVISLFELIGLAGLFSIITVLINENALENYHSKVETHLGIGLSQAQFIIGTLFGILIFFGIKNMLSYYIDAKSLILIEKLSKALNERIIRNFFEKGYWHFKGEKMFSLTQKASTIPNEFSYTSLKAFWQLISEFTILTLFIILSFSTSLIFSSLLILMSIPVAFYAFNRIKTKAKAAGSARLNQQPKTARELYDLFTGFVEMKIYSSAEHFLALFLNSLEKLNKLKTKENKLSLMPKRILELLAVLVVIIIYLIHLIGENLGYNTSILLDVGLLGIFGYKILPGAARIIESLVQLSNTELARYSLYENLKPILKVNYEDIDYFQFLEFENINFSFGDKVILNDFSFSIKKGDLIGLMGASGTGKSTMAKVFLGLLKADSGTIKINGKPCNIYLNENWQHKLGYIGAESFMLDATIYENIAFSKESIDEDKVQTLLTQCQLSEYINNNISIGELGNKLSSGLKQRIALARALYHDPEMLILDEFSSNLDYENEDLLLDQIEKLAHSRETTILVISHRPRTMKIADKVYGLENGRLKLKVVEDT